MNHLTNIRLSDIPGRGRREEILVMQSKLLYTPTANLKNETALFGGAIWRCSFMTEADVDRRKCCLQLTQFFSRVVFYYHNVIYHRDVKLNFRWVVLDYGVPNPTTSALCYTDWNFIIKFLKESTQEQKEDSSELRKLFGAYLHILKTIYYSHSLFLIRDGGFSNRQTALDLLVQVAGVLLQGVNYLDITEILVMEQMTLELKPALIGKVYPFISERRFDFTIPGGVSYLYHTFQYCAHSKGRSCESCQNNHTAHKEHTRQFLASTHPST